MANNNRKPEFPLTPELSNFTFELAKEIGIDTKLKKGMPQISNTTSSSDTLTEK